MSATAPQIRHVATTVFRDGQWTPRCRCEWEGTPTRWSAVAQREANQHLASVDQPALPPLPTRRSDYQRRYVG